MSAYQGLVCLSPLDSSDKIPADPRHASVDKVGIEDEWMHGLLTEIQNSNSKAGTLNDKICGDLIIFKEIKLLIHTSFHLFI